ncbi:NADH-quinone oxidoreductase subunit J family protein [Desulforhabdus amnigena]|jgi:NADH-quinone oxidoreductase subunit J|uniref:NADH-quinone oxidoreductase subunit J n=1 Tax=Desulforhabdus amnigena TaxID=40218 RepID=A0A9W6D1L6_9BACT|nr:NADH-quinone oxidoreductase subunit J [Desulforhabdus amnigena]NLJ28959.1 NADH-ubiquinone/plastoquinone oxidoreductase subunit 6 [Deltaproteobacteria bacterium]GLI33613.1 NADH dehydrogenase subunit J [Desulforhabdus amnigena]
MTFFTCIFYVLAASIVASTGLAVTRRNLVHAVIYLIFSFFGSAMLFYLLGAPLLAVLEVIIYAGAIMILFLFIIMMVKVESSGERMFPSSQWLPTVFFGLFYLGIGAVIVFTAPGSAIHLTMAVATPRELGLYLFQWHWLSIEIVSLLLLVAIIGALLLGRKKGSEESEGRV